MSELEKENGIKVKNNNNKKLKKMSLEKKESKLFYVFISPWLFGFIFLTLGPMLVSFFMSFTNWDMFNKPEFIGLANFKDLFSDEIFYKIIYNTFYYAILAVPIDLMLSVLIAWLLNFKVKGMKFFRTIFYLPSLVPAVASVVVFKHLLAPDEGLINKFLGLFGIDGPAWLLDPEYVKMSFIFLVIWGVGGSMILLLSGMKGVPNEMYEAAEIDGAGIFSQFKNITLPMLSPVLFFNLINGIIGAFQTFSVVYLMTRGGPDNASQMIVPYLFDSAFKDFRMGYSSAIAWILFVVVLILTMFVFKGSSFWVFYEGEVKSNAK